MILTGNHTYKGKLLSLNISLSINNITKDITSIHKLMNQNIIYDDLGYKIIGIETLHSKEGQIESISDHVSLLLKLI